jgi:hypothetical protein
VAGPARLYVISFYITKIYKFRILDFCPLLMKELFPITFIFLRIVMVITIIRLVLLLPTIMQDIDF